MQNKKDCLTVRILINFELDPASRNEQASANDRVRKSRELVGS